MLNQADQRTLAYSRAYELFSHLYQHGITATTASIIPALPDFPTFDRNTADFAHFGAQHYRLFGYSVYPYEAIFLGEDRLLGGTLTEAVAQFYTEVGFPVPDDESADHIAVELALLAFLTGAEADAEADGAHQHVYRLRNLQRRFLEDHLLRWLPALTYAVQMQGNAFYSALASQTLDLVLSHREALGDDLMSGSFPFRLPDAPDLVNHEKTSLRDIARYLLTPAYSGVFLSHDDIARLGTAYRLPRGFGSREQTLTNLLRTAADYDAVDDVFGAISTSVGAWAGFYSGLDTLPAAIRETWLVRLAHTQTQLHTLRQLAAEQLGSDLWIDDTLIASGSTGAGCATDRDGNDGDTC